MTKNALVVEDTPANKDFLERLMKMAGFEVYGATSGEEALQTVSTLDSIALAIIDMELPDISGLILTSELRKRFSDAYLVVATMHDERSLMESVFSKGGNCFLVKPHGFMELYRRLITNSIADLLTGECIIIDQYGPRNQQGALVG